MLAAGLALETGCSDDGSSAQTIVCRVYDPRTNTVAVREVSALSTCPPPSTVHTAAHGASPGYAGWYYYHGGSYYGNPPAGATYATQDEAERLQRAATASEADVAHENAEAVRSAESIRAGGFGESSGHAFGG